MKNIGKSEIRPAPKHKKRFLKIFIGLILLIIVLTFFLVPVFVSSKKGRQIILSQINKSIEGRASYDSLSMGWLKGIKIWHLTFDDDTAGLSVQVDQIATKPNYGSILAGNLSFGQTTIDKPNIQINIKEQLPKSAAPEREPTGASTKNAGVAIATDVVVNDGSLKITDLQSQTVEVTNINSKVNLRPPGQQTNFQMSLAVAGTDPQSSVSAEGSVTPSEQGWSLKGTSGDLTVEVNDLDLESLGPFMALAGVDIRAKGIVRGNLKGEIIDGKLENLNTGINAQGLDVSGAELKGDRIQTSNLDINAKLNQKNELINIDNLQVKSDWASVTASGAVPTTFGSFSDLLKADSGYDIKGTFECDIPAVMSQLPNTLKMQEGTTITSGRLNGNIDTVTQSGAKKIQARATLSGLEGVVEQKKIAMSEPVIAETLISSDQTGIKFDKADLSAPFAKINCSGSTEQIRFNADADLGKLQAELGQFVDIGPYQMAGRFQGSGEISIKTESITASGSSQVSNLKLTDVNDFTVSESKADVTFNIEINNKENIVAVNSITTETSFGRINIKDAVVPLNELAAKPMNLLVNASNLDLAKILPFAVMFGSLPKEMMLAGIGESEMQISSENNIYHIVTEKTKFKDFEFIYPGEKPFKQPDVSIVADIKLDTIEKIPTGKFNLISDIFKISLNIYNQKKNNVASELKGNAELEYDWATVNTFAAPYLPEGLSLEGQRKDSITFSSEYPTGQTDQIMANLNASGKVGFEKADYMGLNFSKTDVDIEVQNGLLKIIPFTTAVNGGQINFAADVDFKQAAPAFTTPQPVSIKGVQIDENVAGKLLKYVNPIFANAVGAKGTANFSAQTIVIPLTKADKNKIQVVGAVGIDDMQLRPTGFLGDLITLINVQDPKALMKLHSTNFTLQDGSVRYDNMQIDIGNTPVNFKGSIGLNKKLDMMVAVRISSLAKKFGLNTGSSGSIIWLPLTGTIDNPKLDTSKLLESQIPELLKGLGDILK